MGSEQDENLSKSLMELKFQEMLQVFFNPGYRGRGAGGNAGTPSGDLMWKSGSRAESSVQALSAVCSE